VSSGGGLLAPYCRTIAEADARSIDGSLDSLGFTAYSLAPGVTPIHALRSAPNSISVSRIFAAGRPGPVAYEDRGLWLAHRIELRSRGRRVVVAAQVGMRTVTALWVGYANACEAALHLAGYDRARDGNPDSCFGRFARRMRRAGARGADPG